MHFLRGAVPTNDEDGISLHPDDGELLRQFNDRYHYADSTGNLWLKNCGEATIANGQ